MENKNKVPKIDLKGFYELESEANAKHLFILIRTTIIYMLDSACLLSSDPSKALARYIIT